MVPSDNNLDPFGLRRAAEAARKGPTHIKFLFVFVGVGIIMSFLVLASIAPQVGDRLGQLAVKKERQKSFAAEPKTSPSPSPTTFPQPKQPLN